MPEIKIAGRAFEVPVRYAEGHQLTANEAAALNKTLHENIRNNIAGKIRKVTGGDKLEWDDQHAAHWQDQVNSFANSYEFGYSHRSGRGPAVNPETKLAIEEAEAAITMGVRNQGQTPPKGKALRELAHQVLAGPQGDHFRQLAKRRIRTTQASAASVMEGLLKAAE